MSFIIQPHKVYREENSKIWKELSAKHFEAVIGGYRHELWIYDGLSIPLFTTCVGSHPFVNYSIHNRRNDCAKLENWYFKRITYHSFPYTKPVEILLNKEILSITLKKWIEEKVHSFFNITGN